MLLKFTQVQMTSVPCLHLKDVTLQVRMLGSSTVDNCRCDVVVVVEGDEFLLAACRLAAHVLAACMWADTQCVCMCAMCVFCIQLKKLLHITLEGSYSGSHGVQLRRLA